ncbi:hypothetical protein C8Q78DRAFT_1005832 [Trametes maxima]|nr:hypothetical protein C8Q78DRAFT_1005832 [Trametes maxima]
MCWTRRSPLQPRARARVLGRRRRRGRRPSGGRGTEGAGRWRRTPEGDGDERGLLVLGWGCAEAGKRGSGFGGMTTLAGWMDGGTWEGGRGRQTDRLVVAVGREDSLYMHACTAGVCP